ncbi:VanZ family protein [uncultured Psychroserpens sp.]|uniref:VanZ family protein n=1 Tax=uncultured Psychroserpens sp. TaxID=255436 RepID=UPI00260CFF7C|nr:VanZ family protein [uncultured Psychroserpens sp.]
MLKRWALVILIVYLIALTIGSLSNIGVVPNLGLSYDDKIYHCIAYALLTLLLFNYLRTIKKNYMILIAVVIAITYGIIIEALQSILTDFRTPDYLDVIANTIGVILASLLLHYRNKLKLK